MKGFLVCIVSCSALRFNEVAPDVDLVEGSRRRRRSAYDSANVEYIIRYPGKRSTDTAKITAYQVKLVEDISSLVYGALQLTANVAETSPNVVKLVKAGMKVAPWDLASSLLQSRTEAAFFSDLVSWPENPGWKTLAPVTPSVFDSLFKTSTFTSDLQTKLRANKGLAAYTGYGVDNTRDMVVTERTVSTSTLKGTFKLRLTVSDPPGVGHGEPTLGSFATATAVTTAAEGNALALVMQAKDALAAAFGASKDFISIERSDYLSKKCSSQIMFNFATTSEAGNLEVAADSLADAAQMDLTFQALFANAGALVLDVDADKVTVAHFMSKETNLKGTTQGIGTSPRRFNVQLKYETPCTGLTNDKPNAADQEAVAVNTAIGSGAVNNDAHLAIVQKIYDEVRKSVPHNVVFGKTAGATFDAAAAGGKSSLNPKQITMPVFTMVADNLKLGTGDGGNTGRIYTGAKGKYNTEEATTDMNEVWGEVANDVGAVPQNKNADYRVKYEIRIKNAINSKAAKIIGEYTAMAVASGKDTDAFSVKVKDSLAGALSLLEIGCTVTNVWMRSEDTETIF